MKWQAIELVSPRPPKRSLGPGSAAGVRRGDAPR
jgi:hypothetical protein